MPTYLSPGVYMEEVSSGSKPIEGVGTAVAGFVGFAERGPVHAPTLVTNWTQFTQSFGRNQGKQDSRGGHAARWSDTQQEVKPGPMAVSNVRAGRPAVMRRSRTKSAVGADMLP